MQLDEHQQRAACAPEARVLVSAVPGSGKTRTLVQRFKHLVEDRNIHPSKILLLTFTRYAAGEISARIGDDGGQAFIGTFHGFALQVIKAHGHARGWRYDWLTILDEDESQLELDETLSDLLIKDRRGKWKLGSLGEWQRFTNDLISGADITDSRPEYQTAWYWLMKRLQAQNVLTYGAMIVEALALLRVPEILESVKAQYRHILVDEAQDSDQNQWGLIETLDPETLFAVGDVDQAIFEWRGARPDLFRKYAEEATRYDLPYSYRFDFNVAKPANALISHNEDRLDIAIEAMASHEGRVETVNGADYEAIEGLISEELQRGSTSEDIAVLARTHAILGEVEGALRKKGIQCHKIGGTTALTKTAEFRAVRGYLRLAVNQRDRQAFMAIATPEHIETGELWKLREESSLARKSLLEVYAKPLPKTLDEIDAHLRKQLPEKDFSPALLHIAGIQDAAGITDQGELVKYMAMQDIQDAFKHGAKGIPLTTIHAAKGLEWPTVFLVGMNAGTFPSKRAVREGSLEDERRLCYVAMTRAEERLVMVQTNQAIFGDVVAKPSGFFAEMEE